LHSRASKSNLHEDPSIEGRERSDFMVEQSQRSKLIISSNDEIIANIIEGGQPGPFNQDYYNQK